MLDVDLHESKDDEISRMVKIRSVSSNEIAIMRTGVDSRKLAKSALHGDLSGVSCCGAELKKSLLHFCLLFQFVISFSTEFWTMSIEIEELGGGLDRGA